MQYSMWLMLGQEGRDVGGGGLIDHGGICKPKQGSEKDPLTYWKPVELFKEWGNMTILAQPSDELGSSVLR